MHLFLAAAILLAAPPARAGTVGVSNLGESPFGDATTSSFIWLANSFQTDASAPQFILNDATLFMGNASNTNGNFFVSIFTNNVNQPGTLLETLSGTMNPAAVGNHTYSSTGLILDPNTLYWVAAMVTSGSGAYNWRQTTSPAYTGEWSIPSSPTRSSAFSGTWGAGLDGSPYQFSISATPVPEPGHYAALFAAGALGLALWRRHFSKRFEK